MQMLKSGVKHAADASKPEGSAVLAAHPKLEVFNNRNLGITRQGKALSVAIPPVCHRIGIDARLLPGSW